MAKDILSPKNDSNSWSLKTENETITDPERIANSFIEFFVEKISQLKENINKEEIEDPLKRLKKKKSNNNLAFSIKKVDRKSLKK